MFESSQVPVLCWGRGGTKLKWFKSVKIHVWTENVQIKQYISKHAKYKMGSKYATIRNYEARQGVHLERDECLHIFL